MKNDIVTTALEIQRDRGTQEAASFMRAMGLPIEQALRVLVPGWQERQVSRATLDFSQT